MNGTSIDSIESNVAALSLVEDANRSKPVEDRLIVGVDFGTTVRTWRHYASSSGLEYGAVCEKCAARCASLHILHHRLRRCDTLHEYG